MKKQTRTPVIAGTFAMLVAAAFQPACAPGDVSPEEARAIAKEAYTYGFPMVDSYRIMYSYFVDSANPEYKAPWNQLRNIPRVFTPEDRAVQTPNSDTPYSMIGLDLRAEPIVLTVPEIDPERYFSIQLIDLYTHNFDYIGSRTTGNGGGSYLIAGPAWSGDVPAGIDRVMRSETELAIGIYRTQLFDPSDLDNVKAVQAGYRAEPLSAFLGQPALPAPPTIDFPQPLSADKQRTSSEFFDILNFTLQFAPTHPSEEDLMARFATVGVGAGLEFDGDDSPEMKTVIEQGIADAWEAQAALKQLVDAGEVTSGDMFGTREYLQNNYAYRMAAAVLGIYGNSKQEAMYPVYMTDAEGQPLDGGANRYVLRFGPPGQASPVNAFWSLTMYELPSSLLSANPLDRYLINSPMLPQLRRDADGSVTLVIQHDSPGQAMEPNWLPAPDGPFFMVLRLYWPKDEVLDGSRTPPALERGN